MGRTYDAVIVGGGLAGTAVAAELALVAPPGFRALLAEPSEPGPGTGYAPTSDRLYMNGTALAMSAVAGDKDHLVRWLRDRSDQALISRKLFGRYLAERFRTAIEQQPGFEVVRRRIVDLVTTEGGFVAIDDRGDECVARDVILALGNFPPDDSFLPADLRTHRSFVADPWRFGGDLPAGDALIVGSGLTAMDTIALLDERGFDAKLHVVSRHGLCPHVENPAARALDPKSIAIRSETPRALLHSLRAAARRHVANGGDWRDIVDSIRADSPAIWMGWSLRERRRFLRHLQAFWAIHRYRVPPATGAVYERLERAGRIVRHRGRIVGARLLPDATVRVEIENASGALAITVASAINCTGPNGDYTRVRDPLVRNLVRRGILRPDPLHLGIDATPEQHAIDRRGRSNPHLFALGPPLRGLWYEATAVPETREQAARIARRLMAGLMTAGLGAAS